MINIISLISAIGIGIGSMALIIILSVYNGFDTLIKSFYEEYRADFIITPSTGKTFFINTPEFKKIESLSQVAWLSPVVEENVFIRYNQIQSIAFIKGVDTLYGKISGVEKNIIEGGFKIMEGELPHAVIGRQLAANLRLRVRFIEPIEIYFPDRKASVSLVNPSASLKIESVFPGGIISLEQEFDQTGLFVPITLVRKLLSYQEDEVTSLEIYLHGSQERKGLANYHSSFSAGVEREIKSILSGGNYIIKNRYEQNETLYKMMRAEKFAVYLILFFVILIISVNIFGSLSMLIIDKKADVETYKSMGASKKLINRIFLFQGWFISLLGAAAGIVLGLILCFIQQKTGIISMPGSYIVNAYPVDIHLLDVIITFAGVAAIGYLIAVVPIRTLK